MLLKMDKRLMHHWRVVFLLLGVNSLMNALALAENKQPQTVIDQFQNINSNHSVPEAACLKDTLPLICTDPVKAICSPDKFIDQVESDEKKNQQSNPLTLAGSI